MPRSAAKYVYEQAFKIMFYQCWNGHLELIWNSRDGETPFTVDCRFCERISQHWFRNDWDKRLPDYKPWRTQRYFRDGTYGEALIIAKARFEGKDVPEKAILDLANAINVPGWTMVDIHHE